MPIFCPPLLIGTKPQYPARFAKKNILEGSHGPVFKEGTFFFVLWGAQTLLNAPRDGHRLFGCPHRVTGDKPPVGCGYIGPWNRFLGPQRYPDTGGGSQIRWLLLPVKLGRGRIPPRGRPFLCLRKGKKVTYMGPVPYNITTGADKKSFIVFFFPYILLPSP